MYLPEPPAYPQGWVQHQQPRAPTHLPDELQQQVPVVIGTVRRVVVAYGAGRVDDDAEIDHLLALCSERRHGRVSTNQQAADPGALGGGGLAHVTSSKRDSEATSGSIAFNLC